MKKDEAVSTVIALMLALGIIATLIAIYSATYLPGLKQQSEIEHSHEVADAFVRFGSDIDYVVSHKTKARFGEPFSLGGGDVLLSPVRSSGTVAIEGQPLANVTVTGMGQTKGTASLVNISYTPSYTTWEPQGYLWEYGFVAVTKDRRATPQSSRYTTMNEARDNSTDFLGLFIEMTHSVDGIAITLVNLTPKKDESFITGSGIATLHLTAPEPRSVSLPGTTKIVFEDITSGTQMPGIENYLKKICNEIRGTGLATYTAEGSFHTLTFDPSVTVTLRTVNVEVNVC
ncbi:hypothetical protein [Methanofollis ethanolicus]|uniref:hypothetical protein n=1 Tax=Methanofollis ethanolicus TaxID=488124 RepID=UPI000829866A|nr:hypothetical protein [Methanofollis ethanolicus]